MGSRKYNRILLCVGAAAIAGVINGGDVSVADAQQNLVTVQELPQAQTSLLGIKEIWRSVGAEHPYIDGLEDIGGEVLQKLAEAEESGEEIVLFARVRDLSGTRVFANVSNYVNVRKSGTTSSDIVGKLYAGCVATVIEEDGNWVYVNSGNVTGYVVKDYLLLGDEAEAAIAKMYAPKIEVTANVLNVRSGAGTGYNVLDTFHKGDTAELLEQGREWMKIRFTSGGQTKTGYVYATYVKVSGEPKCGETLAEEKARIEAEQKAAAEAAKRAEEAKKAAIEQSKRDKAKQVAEYAKTAVGVDYVWGGTNMSSGVDCSGLCYAAYKKYGYTLPRVSRDMAASKNLLSVTPNTSNLRAGDLVFYASSGRVDHVAMYIGDGKVVHASGYETGVIISKYNYRPPHSAKRVIY